MRPIFMTTHKLINTYVYIVYLKGRLMLYPQRRLRTSTKEKTMGRPINKKYFGETGNINNPTIPVRYYAAGESVEGYIVSQKATNKFKVNGASGLALCRLVNKIAPDAYGECAVVGMLDGSPVIIKKLRNKTVIDWYNNRYTWEVQDDSSESILVLTAI